MGAIRPPWITKKDFYRTPFNFCDRWCERCHLTKICKVYKEGVRDRKRATKEGKDPDSWEFTFEIIHKNLQKTIKLLYKGAKKWGIDIEELNKFDEKDYQKYEEEHEALQNHPLYKLSMKWSEHVRDFLKNFTEIPIETPMSVAVEAREILSWYQTLIPAKVYRALSSEDFEKERPEEIYSYDDKTSAFIAYHGLIKVSEALLRLATEKLFRAKRKQCLLISEECLNFARNLSTKFYFDAEQKRQN